MKHHASSLITLDAALALESGTDNCPMNEDRLQFLVTLNDRLRPLRDPVEMQEVAVRLLGEHLRVNRVAFAEIDGDEFLVVRSFVNGVAPLMERGPIAVFGEALRDTYERGETVVVNDIRDDPRFTDVEREGNSGERDCGFFRRDAAQGKRRDGWRRSVSTAGYLASGHATRSPCSSTAERAWAAGERARAEEALRKSEQRHAFLLKLSDALRALSDPSDVQQTAARLLGEHLQVNRVGCAEIEGREDVIRCEHTRGVPPLVGHGLSGTFGVALRDAYRRGETVVVNDVASDSRFTESERVTMEGRQIAAFVGVTLIKGGRMVAAIGANNATPRVWTPTEIALVCDVAERTWEAAERARAEAVSRDREHRLQLALDASAAGVWTWHARTNLLDWDERVHAHYGLVPGSSPSLDSWISSLHEDDRQRVLDRLGHILRLPTTTSGTRLFASCTRTAPNAGCTASAEPNVIRTGGSRGWEESASTSRSGGARRRHCRRVVTRSTIASCDCCWRLRRRASRPWTRTV